jgi:hypothetical protein
MEIPIWIAGVVVIFDLLLAGLVVVGAERAARRAGLTTTIRSRLRTVLAIVLTGWLALAVVVAAAALPPLHPAVLGLIFGPVILGLVLLAASPTWQSVVAAVPQEWLISAQAYRVVGAVFLVVWMQDGLPAFFALPAGVGDILTGVAAVALAPFVARRARGWRSAAVGWNLFGLADLVVAFGAGSTLLAGPLSVLFAAETTTAAIVALPLGLVPLFLVPISVTLHCYSLWGLRTPARPAPAAVADGAEEGSGA